MQCELEPAEGAAVEGKRPLISNGVVLPDTPAAGADDVLSDTGGGLGPAGVSLRLSLVVVLMTGQEERDAAVDQRRVDRLKLRSIGITPARLVHVGQNASLRVRGKVALQPLKLSTARRDVTFGVQLHDVPVAEIEGAVALRRASRQCAEVAEVARGARRCVVLIAGSGSSRGLEAAVGVSYAVLKLANSPLLYCRSPNARNAAGRAFRIELDTALC